jgi:hypothetical protein
VPIKGVPEFEENHVVNEYLRAQNQYTIITKQNTQDVIDPMDHSRLQGYHQIVSRMCSPLLICASKD